MEAMQTHNLKMTLKVHVLVHHVPKYVCHTGVPLGSNPEEVVERRHTLFDIFYHRFEVNCSKSLVFRECLLNAVLRHYSCPLQMAD